jgi:ATP-dependent DNA helicase RecG
LNIRNDETIILSAKEGLSRKFWESYSALANTDGGIIVLGASLLKHNVYELESEINLEEMKSRFWQELNTIGNISCTELTTTNDVIVKPVVEERLLSISVKRASRIHRPVFTGHDPVTGSYGSKYTSIYNLSLDEVIGCYMDRSLKSFDSYIKTNLTLSDLDSKSLSEYRELFVKHNPNHEWSDSGLDPEEFWTKLNVLCKDRNTGHFSISIAGLLMFGTEQALSDPELRINLHLEYRRHQSRVSQGKYEDRLQMDGSWTPNLFQFYQRVHGRITEDLIIDPKPTKFKPEFAPVFLGNAELDIFETLKKVLVNALIQADYRGQGSVLVERFFDRMEISFSGTLSNNLEEPQITRATHCRNPIIQRIFNMIGIGDITCIEFEFLSDPWEQQGWHQFKLIQDYNPNRAILIVPIGSNSSKALVANRKFQTDKKLLDCAAIQKYAILLAEIEGFVTNSRLQQIYDLPSTSITKALKQLTRIGILYKKGNGRSAVYRITNLRTQKRASVHMQHKQNSKFIKKKDLNDLEEREMNIILESIALPAIQKERMSKPDLHQIIVEMCRRKELTAYDLHVYLDRKPRVLRNNYLTPAVRSGELLLKYPDNINHPKQAYRGKPEPLIFLPDDEGVGSM